MGIPSSFIFQVLINKSCCIFCLTEKNGIRYTVYQMISSIEKLRILSKPILRDEVFASIKEAILIGELPPGQRLSIGSLQQQIGFSHTPIREALLMLEQEGIVSRLPKGGFIVKPISQKDTDEIFEIRVLLESYAAELASKNVTNEDILVLEQNLRDAEKCLVRNDLGRMSALNTEFHNYLNGLSRNQQLLNLINVLSDRIIQYRSIILRVPGMAQVAVVHHRKMIDTLKEKDWKQLKELTCEHILTGKKMILSEIKN